jgi:predicted acetyltransferase
VDITLRPISDDELDDMVRAAALAFGFEYSEEFTHAERLVFEPDRATGAFEGNHLVGTSATATFQVTVPGAEVPAAGLTTVSVIPTHRRRGVLTALMEHHLEDASRHGEPLSILWASEAAIYGRYGYGMATASCRFTIDRAHSLFAQPHQPTGRTRVVDQEEALRSFPEIYGREQASHPGMIRWTPAWWRYFLTHPMHHKDGAPTYVLHETGGVLDGYLDYKFKRSWDEGVPTGTVEVDDLIANSPGAYADLWRYCLNLDLASQVTGWHLRPDEPLLHLLAEPRRLRLTMGDGLWVRLVDVSSALAARRYAASERLTIAVRDAFSPKNEGVYELEGGPDGAECRPASEEPQLTLGVADLGAAYLGGTRFRTLERAGRVVEETPGAIARADAMFAWDPPPWSPHTF